MLLCFNHCKSNVIFTAVDKCSLTGREEESEGERECVYESFPFDVSLSLMSSMVLG